MGAAMWSPTGESIGEEILRWIGHCIPDVMAAQQAYDAR